MAVPLAGAPKLTGSGSVELGIRPEFVKLERGGLPVSIEKVEDIGRQKIVRARFAGQRIAIVVPEDDEIPADAGIRLDPSAIGIFADSWRVKMEA